MFRVLTVILFFLFLTSYIAIAYNAELIYNEEVIEVKNAKLIRNSSFKIKINNREGDDYSKVQIQFSKMRKVSNIKAALYDENRELVRELRKKEIEERSLISDISFYEDNFVAEFSLKHNSYPYFIEYSYQTVISEFMQIAYWIPVLDYEIPVMEAKLKLKVDKDFPITSISNCMNKTVDAFPDGSIQYLWKCEYKNVLIKEKYAPEIEEDCPYVFISPVNFKYEKSGSNKSWQTFGDWQYSLLEGIDELPEFEKSKILEIVKGAVNDRERITRLFHYLQDQTRYINVSVETGGFKPYSANYVSVNKYGDCKALSNYMKSILDFIGIKSNYTLINAGDQFSQINKEFVSTQFNHAILFVPLENDTVWLDCTTENGFGNVGTFIQNRNALIIEKGNSHFVKTPSLKAKDVEERRLFKFDLTNLSNSDTVTIIYRGIKYEGLKLLNSHASSMSIFQMIKKNIQLGKAPILDYKLKMGHRDTLNVELDIVADFSKNLKQYGDSYYPKLIPFQIPNIGDLERRTRPVVFYFPVYQKDIYYYRLPASYDLKNKIKSIDYTTKYGHFKLDAQVENDQCIVSKELLINEGRYSIDELEPLSKFLQELKGLDKQILIISLNK